MFRRLPTTEQCGATGLLRKSIGALFVLCFLLPGTASNQFLWSQATGKSVAPPTRAEEWPGWRGPTRQGISSETGLPTNWSATENVAWKTAIPGEGWSSPIVYGDRVIITTATDGGASCRVVCLDRRTGKINWNTEVYRQTLSTKNPKNSYATPTPVTDGKLIYAVFGDGGIAALSLQGKIVWVNRDYNFYSVHGCGASPTLYDDLLIFPFDITSGGEDKGVGHTTAWDKSFVVALDKGSGKLRWKATRGLSRVAHVTPQVMNVGGRAQLVSAAGDVVQGYDLKSGERIWTVESLGEGVVPSVVVGGGMIFTASGFGDPTICAIRAGGRGDVTRTHIAWQIKKAVPMVPSFLYVNDYLFTVSEGGVALCVKAATGEVVWQERIGGKHYASPIYADGKIYFLSETGESTIIEAGPQFKVVARNQIDEACQASYAVSRGQLFIRTQENLYCVGPPAGSKQ